MSISLFREAFAALGTGYFKRFTDFVVRTKMYTLYNIFWLLLTTRKDRWYSLSKKVEDGLIASMQEKVESDELKKKIVPDYELGVKRIGASDHYLQSMNKSNFSLITNKIEKVTGIERFYRVSQIKHSKDLTLILNQSIF